MVTNSWVVSLMLCVGYALPVCIHYMLTQIQSFQLVSAGNSDDRFRIGVTLWKKAPQRCLLMHRNLQLHSLQGVRLYAPFDKADILI